MAICGFTCACSGNADTSNKLPEECKEAFSQWDTLLSRMQQSGKFSDMTLNHFKENRSFITRNIQNSPNIEEQRQACVPINLLMQQQLREMNNIGNMTQKEIDHVFDVGRIH